MGKYQQYKRDSQITLSWLIQCAKDNGSDVVTTEDIDPRAARTGQAPKERFDEHRQQLLTAQEILRQIHFLRRCKQTLIMPQAVSRAYTRAIASRQRYNDRYSKDKNVDPDDHEGHVYFLWVLKQIKEVLGKDIKVQLVAPATTTVDDVAAKALTLTNLFATLDLTDAAEEEDYSEAENVPSDATSETSSSSIQSSVYNVKLSEAEELRFEKMCNMEESLNVKDFVITLWKQVNDEENPVDIAIAALVTDAALELIGDQEKQLNEKWKRLEETQIVSTRGDEFYGVLTTLGDLRTLRQQNRKYIFHLPTVDRRHEDMQDEQSRRDDTYLVEFMMELGLECVNDSNLP